MVVPAVPVTFPFQSPTIVAPLVLVFLRLFAVGLYLSYLALVVVDPGLRMGHDLVVISGVRLFDDVVGVQARLAVGTHLKALQDLAIRQQDRNVPLAGERASPKAAPDQHAAAGFPGPLLGPREVEWNVHPGEEPGPQPAKRRGVEVGGHATIVEGVAPVGMLFPAQPA